MHDDVKQQIAELFTQVGIIRALDGVDNLVALLDEQGPQRGMCLLAIPWAAIRGAESSDNFLQAGDAV
jgi:hypothetical protein